MIVSTGLMEDLVRLDEDFMPSSCTVLGVTITPNDRGGSSSTSYVAKHAEPIACRVAPAVPGTRDRAGQLMSTESVTIALSLQGLRDAGVTVDNDDEISVDVSVALPGDDLERTQRYKVNGTPSVGPYSTNLTVPVTKVG